MSDVVDHYINSFDTVKNIKNKKKYNPDAKLTDKIVKHCLVCNICWEFNRDAPKAKKELYCRYLKDFPTYGKKKETNSKRTKRKKL